MSIKGANLYFVDFLLIGIFRSLKRCFQLPTYIPVSSGLITAAYTHKHKILNIKLKIVGFQPIQAVKAITSLISPNPIKLVIPKKNHAMITPQSIKTADIGDTKQEKMMPAIIAGNVS